MLDSIITSEITPVISCCARRHGEGYGFYSSSFKFLVTAQENGQYQAVFLDCCQQLRAVRTLAVWSGVSYAVCIPRSESRSNRSGAAFGGAGLGIYIREEREPLLWKRSR